MTQEKFSREVETEADRQWQILKRNTVDIVPEDEFRLRLKESIRDKRPLRVKQGFDPTSPDIHIGHAVGMRKLRQFQELGHTIVLIVGDYTALVGDPSGQNETRPSLEYDDILKNAETYKDQFFKILDREITEVRSNGDWFKKLDFGDIMKLASKFTVARLLERDDFSNRFKSGTPISIHELFYPLMQAYDSVAIDADIEIGATEQTFNLLAGRTIQEAYGKRPQCILTMPILVGLDGQRKMSKSLGNYVGVDEPPREIFGKIMSIPDDVMLDYYRLCTDLTEDALADLKQKLEQGDTNPMDLKKHLGEVIVDTYYPDGSGREARQEFERVFSRKQLPDEIPEVTYDELRQKGLGPDAIYLVHLMAKTGLAKSNGEARKLIAGGGVYLDDERVTDTDLEFAPDKDRILKVGKRRFLKLKTN